MELNEADIAAIMEEKNPGMQNKDEAAEVVGVGAIVFYYLSSNRIRDINFVMEEALDFNGNTGPYAQYTYARTCSILEKAGEFTAESVSVIEPSEAELVKTLSRFGEAVKNAAVDFEPSVITRYILDVCAAFNRFYHDCPIIGADDEAVRASRLALTKATNIVLGSALPLICLKTPRKI